MEYPLITVVTVVYNGVDSLLQTINSVSDLVYPNLSYIIVDGGSTDGTVDLIKENEGKINLWISEPDQGIYDAMNKAWAMVKDDSYILYLGAGDKILKLPDMLKYPQADVIYGNVALGTSMIFKSAVNWKSYLGNTVHHQSMLVRKSVNPEPPFRLQFKIYADFDFNQRLLKRGIIFYKDDEFFAYALDGGVSAQITNESLAVVKSNYGLVTYFLAKQFYFLQKIYGFRKSFRRNRSL